MTKKKILITGGAGLIGSTFPEENNLTRLTSIFSC